MRLDKFISHTTGLSRSASRRAIKSAAIAINAQTVTDPQREVSDADAVALDGETLTLPGRRYLMLHKPAGYVCATSDSENPTVIDLLSNLSAAEIRGLSIAGRLDKDTTGLLLLSDDGQWIHRLTAPRHNHPKSYIATLERAVSEQDVEAFAQGLQLRSEKQPTRPAVLKPLPENRAEVTITEGRYHQIKRMFAATGNVVLSLHRVQVGDIVLDSALTPGQYRPLTQTEIESVQ
ncbi:MAG: pseudouridine synthase [Cellvibrionaceae bacterium]